MRVFTHALAFAAAALVLLVTFAPSSAEELVNETVVPTAITQTVAMKREQFHTSTQPQLTNALLQAYVDRRQQLDAVVTGQLPLARMQGQRALQFEHRLPIPCVPPDRGESSPTARSRHPLCRVIAGVVS